jgi:predicted small lipoprotein YifL
MMHKARKYVALVLALALVVAMFGIAGCGKKDT